ncbi:flippase-like domain-containing protein [Patulibacter medicamentivorans]|uniref:flippase-like domain-containing protein n=1 Tax=Patulibacter medicamentivorans TaxID=1097667 RepID=UPI00058BFA9B|nr:flippase-like domain-containing protein [Patulibacter medicamentivorans]
MRVALVSPYSWTFPGGVTRHIEALARELREQGHDAQVLAPYDPADRLAARLHRGAWPQERSVPEWLVPLGRTVGVPANGAVSNLAINPSSVARLRTALATGGYDVVHVHEPHAPLLGWDTLLTCDTPLVGTFHCYSANSLTNGAGVVFGARRRLNRLVERIAVSDAAAWTGQRYYGGRYRVIPNGVDLAADATGPADRPGRPPGVMKIAFVGQAVERKGLPILLRAFDALREQLPVELVVIGPEEEEVRRVAFDDRLDGVRILGRVDDETKHRELADADVLCAPSLGGESFGMVLTEAFAQGVPVVASDIVGYRDVVSAGRDGILVPPGDAQALAHTLRDLALRPERRRTMSEAARRSANRYAWPRIAARVVGVYEDAQRAPQPSGVIARAAVRHGFRPADGREPVPARRMPRPDAPVIAGKAARRARRRRLARRGLVAAAVGGTVGLGALALQRIGIDSIANSFVRSSPAWVLMALAVFAISMAFRAISWHAILRAAIPDAALRQRDTFRATAIGVLMSATLPARLGEPSRALIIARRAGRPRERLPVVLGTLVSQTLINVAALVLLGTVMIGSIRLFKDGDGALLTLTIAPVAILLVLLLGPLLLRRHRPRSPKLRELQAKLRGWAHALRSGLRVFTKPRHGFVAISAQLFAWALQWLGCYLLLKAFGIHEGMGAAAAVLFAVNVTAVLPATPSNLGVFQAACVTVLGLGYGVSNADALGYGIVLQAVEIATALALGMPAMLAEGVTWRDVRMRALHASPVDLPPLPAGAVAGSRVGAEAES